MRANTCLKARVEATFLFGLVRFVRNESHVSETVLGAIDGPIRVIRRSRLSIEIGWGLPAPKILSDDYFYADHAERFLAPQEVQTDGSSSAVVFEPLGPVLAVMPWNFPFWQVFRFAAPALMAGNAGLLKHAEIDWDDAFRRAEMLSDSHTFQLGATAIDLWHIVTAELLQADTFWTFDSDQWAVAKAVGNFRHVPQL